MSRGRWFISLCTLLGVVGFSSAGQYIKTPTNPPSFPKNPYGGSYRWEGGNSAAYAIKPNGQYGGGQADAGAFVFCEGTITTVYQWVRDKIPDPNNPGQQIDDPLDDPPAEVIAKEYCIAIAQAWSSTGGAATSADNGLTFTPVNGPLTGGVYSSCEGTLYTKRAGGQTITLTCTPSAGATSNEYDTYASVGYTSEILVPRVSLAGFTRFYSPDARKFITGQQITGQVVGGLTVNSWAWTIENSSTVDAFKSYTATTGTSPSWLGTGLRNDHVSGDFTQSTLSFYTIKNGTTGLKCDVTFTLPANSKWAGGLPNFEAVSPEIESVRPTCESWDIANGIVTLGSVLQFGSGGGPGQDWSNVELKLPAPFSQVGQGAFCQLFNGDRYVHRTTFGAWPAHFYKTPWNAVQTLDVSFPAPAAYAPTFNLPAKGFGADSPYNGLMGDLPPFDMGGSNWDRSTAVDALETWVMYKPPAVGGQGTTWIPMAHYTWQWNGDADRSGPGGSWALLTPQTGHGSNGDLDRNYFIHPTWSKTTPTPFKLSPP